MRLMQQNQQVVKDQSDLTDPDDEEQEQDAVRPQQTMLFGSHQPLPLFEHLPTPPMRPLCMSAPLASQGSSMHLLGLCKPCAWFWRPGGCQKGAECTHCHHCPKGELMARKKAKDASARPKIALTPLFDLPLVSPLVAA